MKSDISIIREWAMPSKHTFTILPIRKLLNSEITDGLWIDPFCGYNSPAKIRNDLNPNVPAEYHMNAIEFLRMFEPNSVDGVLFDPPYSPRQVRECYDEIGTDLPFDGRSSFWSDAKKNDLRHRKTKWKGYLFWMEFNGNRKVKRIHDDKNPTCSARRQS